MPAVSKKQRRFMGVVKGIQEGRGSGSSKAHEAAKSMSKKQVDDFTSTKETDLPVRKKDEKKEAFLRGFSRAIVKSAIGPRAAGMWGTTYKTDALRHMATDPKGLVTHAVQSPSYAPGSLYHGAELADMGLLAGSKTMEHIPRLAKYAPATRGAAHVIGKKVAPPLWAASQAADAMSMYQPVKGQGTTATTTLGTLGQNYRQNVEKDLGKYGGDTWDKRYIYGFMHPGRAISTANQGMLDAGITGATATGNLVRNSGPAATFKYLTTGRLPAPKVRPTEVKPLQVESPIPTAASNMGTNVPQMTNNAGGTYVPPSTEGMQMYKAPNPNNKAMQQWLAGNSVKNNSARAAFLRGLVEKVAQEMPEKQQQLKDFLRITPDTEDKAIHGFADSIDMETEEAEREIYDIAKEHLGDKSDDPMEKLDGGMADGNKPDAPDDEAAAGMAVEMEHTDDPEIAKEITEDHLTEDDEYYTKLKLMEDGELDDEVEGEEPYADDLEPKAAAYLSALVNTLVENGLDPERVAEVVREQGI
jgi:hypothetical protein